MADLPNNQNQPEKPRRKELSMELRLLIAFVLMGIVLFVTPYIYKPPPATKKAPPASTPPAAQVVKEPAPKKPEAPPAVPAAPPAQIAAGKEEIFTVDTDLYTVKLTNTGAVVQSWVLKKFLDSTGKPLELVNVAAQSKVPPPFAIAYKDGAPATQLNSAKFKATPARDGLGVDYEYSDGKTHCRKSFHFTKKTYLSQVTSDLTENGTGRPHLLEWRGGFGDFTALNRQTVQQSVFYDPFQTTTFLGIFPTGQGELKVQNAAAAKNGTVTNTGTFTFAGLEDTFFAALLLPQDKATLEVQTYKDDLLYAKDAKEEPFVGAGVGGDSLNQFSLFVGPKDIDVLKNVDPRLSQLIDWGWFWFIAKPLFLGMHWLTDHATHNYGWSIVVITVIINIILLPLRFTSMRSAKKMQALQPQIQAINAKYKNVGLRDPKKAEQNQEVMDLYKKHGVNPMGGCLPMLPQIPIMYAFYKVLNVTIELRGATWLWVTDLSQPETLPIHVLPIVMIITQFLMQKMTPNPTADPAQAKMMMFMPLMFGFFLYNFSSGLVLYWLTSNLVGIVQQWVMNRATPAPVVAAPPKPGPKKKGSKG
jgi:YidC/Oxa1 family membrane protein insertase